jgi:uncharacterized coiled-coil protein SlyX
MARVNNKTTDWLRIIQIVAQFLLLPLLWLVYSQGQTISELRTDFAVMKERMANIQASLSTGESSASSVAQNEKRISIIEERLSNINTTLQNMDRTLSDHRDASEARKK